MPTLTVWARVDFNFQKLIAVLEGRRLVRTGVRTDDYAHSLLGGGVPWNDDLAETLVAEGFDVRKDGIVYTAVASRRRGLDKPGAEREPVDYSPAAVTRRKTDVREG